jgi:sigma-B regulation protein RsbU (phosphoserine phosphatase)
MALVLDTVPDGVIVAGSDGRFQFFNPAAQRILGIGLKDVLPSEWTSVYGCYRSDMVTPCPPAELPLVRALGGETVSDAELFVKNRARPNGVWLSLDAIPLRGEDGTSRGGVVVFRDVTAKKRQLEQIRLLSTALEQTADCVLITDRNGRIEYVNPAFERVTGYAHDEVAGRNAAILKSGLHDRSFYRELWSTLRAGHVFRATITDRKKSGELFLTQQTISPMRGPGGGISHLVSVLKDITELQRAADLDRELQLARAVQRRLYPREPPELPGFEIAGAAFVANTTGGDLFDFVRLPGDCTGLVIGDVSGHGFDSALLMAEMRGVLRTTARTHSEPGEILSIVNRVLAADMEENRFATLVVAALDPREGTLRYASAGHPSAYILDCSGRVRHELPSTDVPLGLFPDTEYQTSPAVALESRDTLLLFTDGITEAEAPDGRVFGVDAAIELVRRCLKERAGAIVETLCNAARAFEQPGSQRDDMTAVICRAGARP